MKKVLITLSLVVISNLYCDEQLSTYDAVNRLNEATSLLIKKHTQSDEKIKVLESKVNSLIKELEEIKNTQASSIKQDTNSFDLVNVNTTKEIPTLVSYQISITTWNANIRSTPYLNENNVIKRVDIGTRLKVVKIYGDFYQLEDGNYIHNSVADINTPFTKILKSKKAYSKIVDNQIFRKYDMYKKGDLLKIIAIDKNKQWYILEDGSIINLLDVE